MSVCAAMMSHHDAPALAATPAKKVNTENQVVNSQPPSLFPLPSQSPPAPSSFNQAQQSVAGMPSSGYEPSPYRNDQQASFVPQQQASLAPQQQQLQTSDGSLMMPGVNTIETSAPTTITAGSANPNWTIGRNGLIQNPCVDPPSAHGRQTGQY